MLNFNDVRCAVTDIDALLAKESPVRLGDALSLQKDDCRPFVMIFGNNSDTRFLLKTLLELWNFDIQEVETVEESIFIAEFKCPDLILMDVALPFCESLAMLSRMRESNSLKDVPYILLSGMAQKSSRDQAFASGASDYLVKPVNYDLLENSLKSLLNDSNITNREVAYE